MILVSKIPTLNDDILLSEMMDWYRIYRNEGELNEEEREYFKSICSEIKIRGLLDKGLTKHKIRR